MGNPSPVQQHDSTAHKTPSCLQPALVGKIKNFGKIFELSKTRAAYFSGERLGFAHFVPTFPGRGATSGHLAVVQACF